MFISLVITSGCRINVINGFVTGVFGFSLWYEVYIPHFPLGKISVSSKFN